MPGDPTGLLELVDDIQGMYQKKSTAQEIQEVVAARRDIETTLASATESIEKDIRELTRDITEMEQEAAEAEEEECHKKRMHSMNDEFKRSSENVNVLNEQARKLQEHRSQLQERAEELMKRSEALEKMATEAAPLTRLKLSLYAHISRITWDFKRRSRVSGSVSDKDSKDVRAFSFDPQQMTEFELTQRLWEVIG